MYFSLENLAKRRNYLVKKLIYLGKIIIISMKQKNYLVFGVIGILVVVGVIFIFTKPADERCKWKPGLCQALISSGYFFNFETKKCEYFQPRQSGCNNPPFQTMEECKIVCEK